MATFLLTVIVITGLQPAPSTADGNVHRLGLQLTAEGLAVGIVTERAIFAEEDRLTDVTPRSSPAALVAAFNQAQADHRATLKSGTALVRASYVPQRVLHALETRHKNVRIVQRDMSTALVDLVYLLNPEKAGAGIMGGPASDCAPSIAVNVSGDDLSTIDILNSMVKQVRGITWLVHTTTAEILTGSAICAATDAK